ncbi:hypothetical protein [Mesorhizobium sp. M1050]
MAAQLSQQPDWPCCRLCCWPALFGCGRDPGRTKSTPARIAR